MRLLYVRCFMCGLVVLTGNALVHAQWNGYAAPSRPASLQSNQANSPYATYAGRALPAAAKMSTAPVAPGATESAAPYGGCPTCDVGGYSSDSGYCGAGAGSCGGGMGLGRFSELFNGECGCGSGWFAGGGAVIMNRDNENVKNLNFAAAFPATPVLTNRSAEMDYTGGAEAYIGKCLGSGWAIEARYWGLEDDSEANTIGAYNPIAGFNALSYDDGGGAQSVYDWYATATRHRLRREYEFDNLEVNFIKTQCSVCQPQCRISFLAGFRYFRFDEYFEFSQTADPGWQFTGALDETCWHIDVDNDLYGFQLGCDGEYRVKNCLTLVAKSRFGIYGNHVDQRQNIVGNNGYAYVDDPTGGPGGGPHPYDGQDFNVSSEKSDVSFLGELNLGVQYARRCWTMYGGYRAVAVSGIALTGNQLPQDYRDLAAVSLIDTNGSLVLHGARFGIERRW